MRFDWCKANLHTSCEEHKYDHCEMCNIARAYQHGYETAQEDMSKDAVEVVRCKDCKYKRLYDEGETKYYYCALEDRPNRNWSVDDTDYCSWGEKGEVEK